MKKYDIDYQYIRQLREAQDDSYKVRDLIFKMRVLVNQITDITSNSTFDELTSIGDFMFDIDDKLLGYEKDMFDFAGSVGAEIVENRKNERSK